MGVQLNHTVVGAADAKVSAFWLADVLGLGEPFAFGPFWQVDLDNGVSLDFASVPPGTEIDPIHYAFLIDEDRFTDVYARITKAGLDHWADPHQHVAGEINTHDGGRGVYFLSNDGHYLEVITVPYGGS
ncbi:MAG: VOC family protein [Aquihabitans sp.]